MKPPTSATRNPQSAIRNPQSAIRNPQSAMKNLQRYSLIFILTMLISYFFPPFGGIEGGFFPFWGIRVGQCLAQSTFQISYGTAGNESGNTVFSASDGGFLILGTASSGGAGGIDILFMKTDALGNIQLQKQFGGAGNDYGNSVSETSDGGYIILSRTNSFGAGNDDALLIKLDASGNIQWSKTYGLSDYEQPRIIRTTKTGKIFIAGTTNSAGAGGTDIMLLKLDANGAILWQKAYGGNEGELPYQIDFTKDGGLIIVGFRHDYVTQREVLLMKTDSMGVMQWAKVYRDGNWNIGQGIDETVRMTRQVGGIEEFYISGYTTSYGAGAEDIFVFKTDSAGTILWSKTYGGTGMEISRGVVATASGLLVPGFTTSFGSGGGDIYLLQLDFNGNLLGSRTYGGASSDMVLTEATDNMLQFTNDGGMILLSSTQSFGAGGSDIYLVKAGLDGSSGCNESGTTATQQGVAPFNVFSVTPTVTNLGLTVNVPGLAVNNISLQENIQCTSGILLDEVIKMGVDSGGYIFDRFGNGYTSEQLTRVEQSHPNGYHCTKGIFQLDFTGTFFTTPDITGNSTNTPADVLCAIFDYLNSLIIPATCGGPVYISITSPHLKPNVLGAASSYYENCGLQDLSGIIDGEVWKAINACGNSCTNENGYDGYVVISPDYVWNLDYGAAQGTFSGVDLYYVMLHEITHTLGFASLISATGQSQSNIPNGNFYSRWDSYLTFNGSSVLNWDDCYNVNVGQMDAITGGCSVEFSGPNATAASTNNAGSPVYAPAGGYEGGSSLSHFDITCAGAAPDYVMYYAYTGNRTYTPEELGALCDLGYNLTTGCSTNIAVAGVDDGFGICDPYIIVEMCDNPPVAIPVDVLGNDINAATFDCLRLISGTGNAVGNSTATTGTAINFTPVQAGLIWLTYIPVDANGNRGNITCVRIMVKPCDGETCAILPAICNQICNPYFGNQDADDQYDFPSHGTPDYHNGQSIGNQVDPGYIRMYAQGIDDNCNPLRRSEGILFWVNVVAETTYTFSYYRTLCPNSSGSWHGNGQAVDQVTVMLLNSNAEMGNIPANNPSSDFSIHTPTQSYTILVERDLNEVNEWKQVVVCFTPTASYDMLWIYPEPTPGNYCPGGIWQSEGFCVDDIELVEDVFDLDDVTITCGDATIGEPLCQVSNVTYEWREQGKGGILGTETELDLFCINEERVFELTRIFPTNPLTVFTTTLPQTTCDAKEEVIVTPTNPIIITINTTDDADCAPCNGDGTATADITGGTPPYTYEWTQISPACTTTLCPFAVQTTQTASGLDAGVYQVSVTDAAGCCAKEITTVSNPGITTVTVTDVACEGACDGTAAINTSLTGQLTYILIRQPDDPPGGGDYEYFYPTANPFSGLCAGTYQVIITDPGCCSDIAEFTITEPLPVEISITTTDATCPDGNNGTATAAPAGGTPPYTYVWNDPGSQVTATATGLTPGSYVVTVTDAKGCTQTNIAVVNISMVGGLDVLLSSVSPLCDYSCDGSVTAAPQNGTNPYTYIWAWTDDEGKSHQAFEATVTGLCAGTFSVTVIDDNGCSFAGTVILTAPPPIVVTIVKLSDDANCLVLCQGSGSVQVTNVSGGTPPYTFQFTNATPESCFGIMCGQNNYPSFNYPGNAYFSNLDAGHYILIVTDANGCVATTSVDIINYGTPALTVSTSDAACYGLCDGSATVLPATGVQYFWYEVIRDEENGNETSLVLITTTNNNTFNGFCAGEYQVIMCVGGGCETEITFSIGEPEPMVVVKTSTLVSCAGGNNGTATADASDGTPPYTYEWSTSPSQTGTIATGLTAGTYTVTVTDANGCTLTKNVTVKEPPLLVAIINILVPISCPGGNNGALSVSASGGIFPYSFQWSTGSISAVITGLSSAIYSVTVTDDNSCTAVASIALTDPPDLSLTVVVANPTCFGFNNGFINLSVSGGTPGYTYLWSNLQANEDVTNLIAGAYTVTVTDNHGCSETLSATLTQPPLLTVTTQSTNDFLSCTIPCTGNGSATATASGGTPPYTYTWVKDILTNCFGQSCPPFISFSSQINNLDAGVYTVTVTDANGCPPVTGIATIINTNLPAFTVTPQNTCPNLCNGSASVSPAMFVCYQWVYETPTPNVQLNQFTGLSFANNLCAGDYYVQVTYSNGCTDTKHFTIGTYPPITITFTKTDVSCFSGSNGTATAIPSGGNSPFTYIWNDPPPAQSSSTVTGLTAGTWSVTVTSSKGCTKTASVTITQPALLTLSATQTNVSCFGGNDGTATANPAGGTPPYTYVWNNGQQVQTATGLIAGTYSVTVTDSKNCTATANAVITQPTAINIAIISITDVSCKPLADGAIDIGVTDGTSPYTYMWSNGATTQDISSILEGSYFVTVSDLNGCTATAAATVTEPDMSLSFSTTDVLCHGDATGAIDLTVSVGTPPQPCPSCTFQWDNIDPPNNVNEDQTGLKAGTYSVTVTDAGGDCVTDPLGYTITEPDEIVIAISKTNPTCNGSTNGEATANVSGGASPYSYTWNINTAVNATATGLLPYTGYSVTITDKNNCSVSHDFFLFITDDLNFGYTTVCTDAGVNIGSINVIPSGSFTPYTYQWSTGETTEDISGLFVGTYSITITDNLGCTATSPITITDCCSGKTILWFDEVATGPTSPCDNGDGITNTYDFLYSPCPGQDFGFVVFFQSLADVFPVGTQISIQLDNMEYGSITNSTCNFIVNNTNLNNPVFTLNSSNEPGCQIFFSVTNITLPLDEVYNNTATLTYICSNGNLTTITFDLVYPTACSCDPNYKKVIPNGCGNPGYIAPDQELTYRIMFQNLGTGPAHNIVIRDTIDTDLNLSSIRNIFSSHTITQFNVFPQTREIVFTFNNIQLPPVVTDPDGSVGYIMYSILPNSGLPDGTTITNKTGIYFNGNPPVITNEVINTIVLQPQPVVSISATATTVYSGYTPECSDLTATASGALPPYTYHWITGENSQTITVCPANTDYFSVTAESDGCLSEPDSILINFIDVHCGNNNNKVLICHVPPGNPSNAHEICINSADVSNHLAHGDYLGACATVSAKTTITTEVTPGNIINEKNDNDNVLLTVIPNPVKNRATLSFKVPVTENITITLYSITGEKAAELFTGIAFGNILHKKQLNSNLWQSGIYYCVLYYQNQTFVRKVVVIKQ